eukprot:gene17632-24518_t
MENRDSPRSLLHNGRLIFHDIYRTAKLSEKRTALVRAHASDQFPDIVPNDPWDGRGVLPSCDKALGNGDEIHGDQWNSLQVWHAGLSCQLLLKPMQGILFNIEETDFLKEFNDPGRKQNMKNETGSYRVFLVFELKKGSIIPGDIGIEMDGDNHVSLYPTGSNFPVSDIEQGLASFTIDALVAMEDKCKPFAVFQMVDVGNRYGHDCSYDHIGMNRCVLKALRFALSINTLVEKRSATSFMIKSTTFSADQAAENKIVQTSHDIIDRTSRGHLALDGGRYFLSVSASIDILYMGATIYA